MKPRLLFADRDPGYPESPVAPTDLEQDLAIAPLLDAMADGDPYLRDVARRVLLAAPLLPDQIVHRQEILDDCLRQPEAIQELYQLAGVAADAKRRVHAWIAHEYPSAILRASVTILKDLVGYLEQLHTFALAHRPQTRSPGLSALLESIERDLDEAYLRQVRGYITQLEFNEGVVLTARLGPGATGVDYALREIAPTAWWAKLGEVLPHHASYVYHLPARDENGGRTLNRITDHGINTVANAAAQSADHVLGFLGRLTFEVGFYLCGIHLHQALANIGVPMTRPIVEPPGSHALTGRGLVDPGLALRTGHTPVGSNLDADRKHLILLTGANQGGKSTLLRAIGLAQLMFDAGLFVTADSFRSSPSSGVFTHYRREEDAALRHGKFDDELTRMSRLIDQLTPGALLLLDESFASTNEREGSQIARDILDALGPAGIRTCYATHLFTLSHALAEEHAPENLFLRAQRDRDGNRPFRLVPGEPESTSYAADLYRQVFSTAGPPPIS